MGNFTNSQKLAAVVNHWLQPAIAQIASTNLASIPVLKSMESTIISTGLVTPGYRIGKDLEPMIKPVVTALVQPALENYFAGVPDSAIPEMARSIVATMQQNGGYSILGGMVSFDKADLDELLNLIEKNLPMQENEKYELIK